MVWGGGWSTGTLAGSSNSHLDISRDGVWLACANRDAGSITLIDRATHAKVREIPVGRHPEGVAFLGDTHRLAVAVYGDDTVVFLDADAGTELGRTTVFDEPYGVVSSADGSKVYVTLEYPGQVVEIDAASRTVTRELNVGSMLRGLAMDPRGERLYVTEYHSANVKAVDLATWSVVDAWTTGNNENLARQIVVHPTLPRAYVPHIRSRTHVNHGEGSIVPNLSVVKLNGGEGRRRATKMLDSFFRVYVPANPWEAAVSPDGRTLCIAFAGTNDLFVCDVLDDDYQEISPRKILQVGTNPRAIRFSPDGETFYVLNALDDTIVAFRTRALRPIATIKVCESPLSPSMLRGKVLFYSALEPMASRRWISCSSCHPDGDPDGRTWQNPEGLRNTNSLAGMAWTHPIHWSADRDEVQDFEHTIRSRLMQGRGLIDGDVNDSLGEPNSGLSSDLDALAEYSNSHDIPLSPHAKEGLSPAATRGRELFFSEAVGCANCHAGPLFSDSTPALPFKRHDVGTGGDDPSELMGPEYDTPTLLGVYRTAPYLHHGKAATLRDVLTTANRNDRHGRTSHLTELQIEDLVEFLKCLPYEDPVPAAEAAGMRRVVK
jgi:YVTN family beta-propeller protein